MSEESEKKNRKKNGIQYLNDLKIKKEILSLFKGTTPLRFTDIQQKLEEKGISKKKTSEILKEMVEEGYLEKVEEGYKLKIVPQQFSIIDKLKELQSTYDPEHIYQWRIGGTLWTLAEGLIIGLPASIEENPHLMRILEVLLIRMANIFEAIRSIALTIGFAKEKGLNVSNLPPPKEAVREYLLNIIPHVLGDRSGIDFDGLPTDDLLEITEQISHEMPDKFRSQPIRKELLLKMIAHARNLYTCSHNLEDLEECIRLGSWGDYRFRELYDKYSKVVLIVYPPRFVLDEKGEDERRLYTSLEECIKENKSVATMLVHVSYYDEEVANKVLNNLQLNLLRQEDVENISKLKKLRELHHLFRAGRVLDYVITTKYAKNGELTPEIKEMFEEVLRNYNLKDMILGFWLSVWLSEWTHERPIFKAYLEKESLRKSVKSAIIDFLKVLNVELPSNLDNLIEKGYETAKKLYEMWREDMNKRFKGL